ncbi:hypothetical protein LJR219_002837 [Phenylobacterium sp. LjRoot219]|uniref:hypothetical protein n=1 Tax=Phenylobacterium sp. LjRoot219 TaxID=3342283 RepID=UPI003ECE81D2
MRQPAVLSVAILSVTVSLAAAGPVRAQALPSPSLQQQLDFQLRANDLRARQDQADQRAVILENRLTNLEAQTRTQQALDDLQLQSQTPALPQPPASGPLPQIDASGLVSIPDDTLAASNARVRAAAENRR